MSQSGSSSRHAVSIAEQVLLGALLLAVVAVLSLPPARGVSSVFGWMPLWLVGLPAMALATAFALRLRRMPDLAAGASHRGRRRRQPVDAVGAARRSAATGLRRARRPQAA